jgi:hypothetical protein
MASVEADAAAGSRRDAGASQNAALRWTFGGKRDEFGLVRRHPSRQFCAQHDARRAPGGDITLFDDGGLALGNSQDCPVHRARVQRFTSTFAADARVSSGRSGQNGHPTEAAASTHGRRAARSARSTATC